MNQIKRSFAYPAKYPSTFFHWLMKKQAGSFVIELGMHHRCIHSCFILPNETDLIYSGEEGGLWGICTFQVVRPHNDAQSLKARIV